MGATVNVNFRTVVHKSSNGIFTAFPDVCKTPAPPAPPIPIPYPNIAQSSDTAKGSKKVKIDGNPVNIEGSNLSRSSGDEAGTLKGMVSSQNMAKAEWVMGSIDVKIEGKSTMRLADMLLGNKGGSPNTPPFPLVQPPLVMVPAVPKEDEDDNEVTGVTIK